MPRVTIEEKARRERMKKLAAIADDFDGFDQGREVLTEVRAVQTIFPQIDIATRVHGWPIQRVCMLHGPSNEGKTVMLLGLGKSFLAAEHFFFHVDAEYSTPDPWVVENLGECANYPTFRALRPRNYEEVADMIRKACDKMVKARTQGKIPQHTSALFAIDSLQKLVPKGFMEKIRAPPKKGGKGGGGVDPMAGRGGQVQASFHSAWMKELVPMMHHANAAVLLISRESENTEATGMFDKAYKVGGGTAPYYDSSLVCRVTRKEFVSIGKDETYRVLGEKIRVQIVKTKIGHKDKKVTNCYFHTSNGQHIPAGFDMARDVIELGLSCGVLAKDDGHKVYDMATGDIYGTTHKAVLELTNNPRVLDDLRDRCLMVAQPDDEDEVTE